MPAEVPGGEAGELLRCPRSRIRARPEREMRGDEDAGQEEAGVAAVEEDEDAEEEVHGCQREEQSEEEGGGVERCWAWSARRCW